MQFYQHPSAPVRFRTSNTPRKALISTRSTGRLTTHSSLLGKMERPPHGGGRNCAPDTTSTEVGRRLGTYLTGTINESSASPSAKENAACYTDITHLLVVGHAVKHFRRHKPLAPRLTSHLHAHATGIKNQQQESRTRKRLRGRRGVIKWQPGRAKAAPCAVKNKAKPGRRKHATLNRVAAALLELQETGGAVCPLCPNNPTFRRRDNNQSTSQMQGLTTAWKTGSPEHENKPELAIKIHTYADSTKLGTRDLANTGHEAGGSIGLATYLAFPRATPVVNLVENKLRTTCIRTRNTCAEQ